MKRALAALLFAAIFVAPVATLLIPAATALVETSHGAGWSDAALTPRRTALLWNGVRLALLASGGALLIGGGLACGLVSTSRFWRALAAWAGISILLVPPYIFAYAYSLSLLPGGIAVGAPGALRWPLWFVQDGRAVICLATWSAPLVAALLAAGWLAKGAPAFRLARLDATLPQAFFRAALPAMLDVVLAAFLVGLLVGITEFSVPHLCQVQTWNTEVLAEVQLLGRPGSALRLAWPLALLALLLCVPLALLIRRLREHALDSADLGTATSQRMGPLTLLGVAALLVPLFLMAAQLKSVAAFSEFWRTYRVQWPGTLYTALWSVLLSSAIAVAHDFSSSASQLAAREFARAIWRWVARLIFALAIVAAALPPVLIGDAVVAAYHTVPWIADHSLIVGLAATARLAILPLLLLSASAHTAMPQMQAALVDGATPQQAYRSVRLPAIWPTLLVSGGLLALLSVTEIGATVLARPPAVGSLSVTFLNAIHFGRDDHVIAMSLSLMAACALLALLAGLTLRLRPPLR